jgi:hypothetical protein
MIVGCFEICQRTLTGLDRVTKPAGDNVDLGKTSEGDGMDLL